MKFNFHKWIINKHVHKQSIEPLSHYELQLSTIICIMTQKTGSYGRYRVKHSARRTFDSWVFCMFCLCLYGFSIFFSFSLNQVSLSTLKKTLFILQTSFPHRVRGTISAKTFCIFTWGSYTSCPSNRWQCTYTMIGCGCSRAICDTGSPPQKHSKPATTMRMFTGDDTNRVTDKMLQMRPRSTSGENTALARTTHKPFKQTHDKSNYIHICYTGCKYDSTNLSH